MLHSLSEARDRTFSLMDSQICFHGATTGSPWLNFLNASIWQAWSSSCHVSTPDARTKHPCAFGLSDGGSPNWMGEYRRPWKKKKKGLIWSRFYWKHKTSRDKHTHTKTKNRVNYRGKYLPHLWLTKGSLISQSTKYSYINKKRTMQFLIRQILIRNGWWIYENLLNLTYYGLNLLTGMKIKTSSSSFFFFF